MKKSLLLAIISFISFNGHAQDILQIRSMLLKQAPENKVLLTDLFTYVDSLEVAAIGYSPTYLDSLSLDSLALSKNMYGLAIGLETYLLDKRMNQPKKAIAHLNELSNQLIKSGNSDSLHFVLHAMVAEDCHNFGLNDLCYQHQQKALDIIQQLHQRAMGQLEADLAESQLQLTSSTKISTEIAQTKDQYYQCLLYSLFALGTGIILLIIFLFRSNKFKRKFLALRQRSEERDAEMDQSQRLSVQYKNEGEQFKQTVEMAIQKLNVLETAKINAQNELESWSDESANEFAQLKDEIEQMKTDPSVTNYMQLQNRLGRLQLKNKDKMQLLLQLLKK
jgi:hypothetical protein